MRQAALAAIVLGWGWLAGGASAAGETMKVFFDAVEDGQLVGGMRVFDASDAAVREVFGLDDALLLRGGWAVTTLVDNGPTSNRIDLVLLGDGYTAGELSAYAEHVDNVLVNFLAEEPLAAYATYFNVHRVDVISNESGVDEPNTGIFRDTALDMAYDCAGIDRLLCISVGLANAAASLAPDRDQVLALANSTRYGGAGYPSNDLGTLAGNNGSAVELALHEFGHSFADLADEYVSYNDPYPFGEPFEVNVSTFTAAQQAANSTKWYRWLDLPNVDSFEGADYYESGVYRPTSDSKMRSLNRPFEQINIEQFVLKIYQTVDPIETATAASGTPLPAGSGFYVLPMEPTDHELDVQWSIDGEPVPGAAGLTFTPDYAAMVWGTHVVAVEVVDNTPRVRDETARLALMTETRFWSVDIQPGDCDRDGDQDLLDYAGFQLCMSQPASPGSACACFDTDLSGTVDELDYATMAGAFDGPRATAASDCNNNGIFDPLEIALGVAEDCNSNDVPDGCEFAAGTAADCNSDGVPDPCQLAGNDCDGDDVPDDCTRAGLVAGDPVGVTQCEGGAFLLQVTGADPGLGYQWYRNGMPVSDDARIGGSATDTLMIDPSLPGDSGNYKCHVNAGCVIAESAEASVDVQANPVIDSGPPAILYRCLDQTAVLTLSVSGEGPFSFDWHKNAASLGAADDATLSIPGVDLADEGNYDCFVTGACGSTWSPVTRLVIANPVITAEPQGQCIPSPGATLVLSVAAEGSLNLPDIGYSWRRDGVTIPGAVDATLTIPNVQAGDAGDYQVVVYSLPSPICATNSAIATVQIGGCE